jgi:hypothetical protein
MVTYFSYLVRKATADWCYPVLTADYASLLAEEFGRNPIVNDEAAFDIHPSFVIFPLHYPYISSRV